MMRSRKCIKQVGQRWPTMGPTQFDKFKHAILQASFFQSQNDSSLFIRRTSRGCALLLIYVVDMIISGIDITGTTALKTHLMHHSKMKDLGSLTF